MNRLNTTIKYGLFLLLFLPLAFTPFTMFPWQFGKVIFFQIIVEILLVLFIAYLFFSKQRVEIKKFNFLDWSVFIFLFILFLTSITGTDFVNSFFGEQSRAQGVFLWLHFGAFYFLLINFFKDNTGWKKYLAVSVLAAFLVSLTAVFQDFLPLSFRGDLGPRYSGIIGNPAFLASYLILPVFISFYLFSASIGKKIKWFWLILTILELGVLLQTGIRGAFVGLVVGIFLGIIISLFVISEKKYKLTISALLIISFLTVGGLFLLSNNAYVQKKVPRLTTLIDISVYTKLTTAGTRLMAWNIAWQGIKDNPILGAGMGNYENIFNKYYNPEFLRYGQEETVWDKPHNWFLEIAAAAGALGLISYLMIFIFAFTLVVKNKSPGGLSDLEKAGRVILFSGLIVYSVQNFFLFETFNSLLIFFIMLGFFSINFYDENKFKYLFDNWRKLSIPVFVLIIILFSLSIYKFHYLPLQSSYYMRQADKAGLQVKNLITWSKYVDLAISVPSHLKPDNAVLIADTLAKMDKMEIIHNGRLIKDAALRTAYVLEENSLSHPQSYVYPIWTGQIYITLGQYVDESYLNQAIQALEQAKNIAPNKQEVYVYLGRAYLLNKDFDNSEKVLEQAVVISPELGDPHWFLGLVYVTSGKREEGLIELEKGLKLSVGLQHEKNILYLIDLYSQDENYKKVVDYYKLFIKLIEGEPAEATWRTRLAAAYVALGDKEAAREEVNKAVELDPSLQEEAQKFIKENGL